MISRFSTAAQCALLWREMSALSGKHKRHWETKRRRIHSSDAGPNNSTDPAQKAKQKKDNLLFGQAMQKWNEHHYGDAVVLLKSHRTTYPDSPWAGEADLHLGCQSQFSGSWEEAKFSFDSILNNHQKGEPIYQKVKLRRAVLHMDQGELQEATNAFANLLQTESDWGRRTYAGHWVQQLNLLKAHERELRDCGADCVAYVLASRGQAGLADKARGALAPGPHGFSLGELQTFAQTSGLADASAARLDAGSLDNATTPFVAHYRDRHFVVVSALAADGTLKGYDPRLKSETVLPRGQFGAMWIGLGIFFGTLPPGARPATEEELSQNVGGCCGLPRRESGLGPTGGTWGCGLPVWEVN